MTMKKFYVGVKGIVRDPRGYLLLGREYKSGDFWDTPGGRIDGDEDFEDTLRRELSEELPGIEVASIRSLQGAFRLHDDIEEDISLVLLYFLVEARLPEDVVLSEEHNSYLWVDALDKIPDGLNDSLDSILRNLLQA